LLIRLINGPDCPWWARCERDHRAGSRHAVSV